MCSDSLAWKMPNVSLPGAACSSKLLIVYLALLPTLTSLQAWPGWKTGCPTCGQIPKNAIEQQLDVAGVLRLFLCSLFFFGNCQKYIWVVTAPHVLHVLCLAGEPFSHTLQCSNGVCLFLMGITFAYLQSVLTRRGPTSVCSQCESHLHRSVTVPIINSLPCLYLPV